MGVVIDVGQFVHGQKMFGKRFELKGLLIQLPSSHIVPGGHGFHQVGIDELFIGRFTRNVDHLAEQIQKIDLVGQQVQTNVANVLIAAEAAQRIDENRFPVAPAPDKEKYSRCGHLFVKRISDSLLDERDGILVRQKNLIEILSATLDRTLQDHNRRATGLS